MVSRETMNKPISTSLSLADAILAEFRNGIPAEKISLNFPWLQLSSADRKFLIDQAKGFSPNAKSLLKLLALMVEDVPVEFRWDQIDILMVGFQYLGWDDLQKQIALKKIEIALDELKALIEQQRPDLLNAYSRYSARFYLLRGGFFYENMEIAQAISDFNNAIHYLDQSGLKKSADRVYSLLIVMQRLLEEGTQPLEDNLDENFLFRFLRDEEEKLLDQITELTTRVKELVEETQSKTKQLKILEDQLQEHQKSITKLQNLISESEIYWEFLKEMRQHATAPLWQEVIGMALEQGEIDDPVRAAIERLLLTKKDWDLNILYQVLLRVRGLEEGDISLLVKGLSMIEQGGLALNEDKVKSARLVMEGWESVLTALEREVSHSNESEEFMI